MKKPTKKQKTFLIVIAVLLFAVVLADLILFYTSLENDGIGRGFSRYWRETEVTSSDDLSQESLELINFDVKFLDSPQPVNLDFELLELYEDSVEKINYKFKTGLVEGGRYVDVDGESYDLDGYEVYNLFLNNGCNRLRILYSDVREAQFIIGYSFSHPSCPNPLHGLSVDIIPLGSYQETIFLSSLISEFEEIFDNSDSFLEENVSDLGYRYRQISLLYDLSEALDYLENQDGLISMDSYGVRGVYFEEDSESFDFIFFNNEGFPVKLEMIYEGFLFESSLAGNVPLELKDGREIEYRYSRWEPDSCIRNPIHVSATEGMEFLGEAIDGSSIFVKEDRDDPYLRNLYDNHYLAESRYLSNQIEGDTETPYTYEEFVEVFPVIYWEHPFRKLLRFVREDFTTPSEEIGGCGYSL